MQILKVTSGDFVSRLQLRPSFIKKIQRKPKVTGPQNRWLRSFDKPQIMKVLMNLDGENRRLLLRVDKLAKIKL